MHVDGRVVTDLCYDLLLSIGLAKYKSKYIHYKVWDEKFNGCTVEI